VVADQHQRFGDKYVIKLVGVGDHSFNVIGPQLWNLLPIHIKCSGTLSMFKLTLKLRMFKAEYCNILLSLSLYCTTWTLFIHYCIHV